MKKNEYMIAVENNSHHKEVTRRKTCTDC